MADDTTTRVVKVKVNEGGAWVEKTFTIVPTVGALKQVLEIEQHTTLNIDGNPMPVNTDALPVPDDDAFMYVGYETNTKTGGDRR